MQLVLLLKIVLAGFILAAVLAGCTNPPLKETINPNECSLVGFFAARYDLGPVNYAIYLTSCVRFIGHSFHNFISVNCNLI